MNFDTRAKAQVELYEALWKKEEEKPEIWLGLLDQHGDAQTDFECPIKTGDLRTFGAFVITPEQFNDLKRSTEWREVINPLAGVMQ